MRSVWYNKFKFVGKDPFQQSIFDTKNKEIPIRA